jgi:hypothetical protein
MIGLSYLYFLNAHLKLKEINQIVTENLTIDHARQIYLRSGYMILA